MIVSSSRSRNARCPRTASSCETTSFQRSRRRRPRRSREPRACGSGSTAARSSRRCATGPSSGTSTPRRRVPSPPAAHAGARGPGSPRLHAAAREQPDLVSGLLVPEQQDATLPAEDRRDPDTRLGHRSARRRAESSSAALAGGELLDLDQAYRGDGRDDELRDAHAWLDGERRSRGRCSGARRGSLRDTRSRSGQVSSRRRCRGERRGRSEAGRSLHSPRGSRRRCPSLRWPAPRAEDGVFARDEVEAGIALVCPLGITHPSCRRRKRPRSPGGRLQLGLVRARESARTAPSQPVEAAPGPGRPPQCLAARRSARRARTGRERPPVGIGHEETHVLEAV